MSGLFSHYDAALEVGRPVLGTTGPMPGKRLDAPLRARDGGISALVAAAAVAATSVRAVGRAIDVYNGRVDSLNAQWRSAKATGFGVAPVECAADASEDDIRRAWVRHADRLLDAKLELLSRLEQEHSRARHELDAAIAVAAERLTKGPTPEVLRELVAAGEVPSAVLGHRD
jgi:hypothetical protein